MTLVHIIKYISAGVFQDARGTACLPILATLPGADAARSLLLYKGDVIDAADQASHTGQWLCQTPGRGNFLQQKVAGTAFQVSEFDEVRCEISTQCQL